VLALERRVAGALLPRCHRSRRCSSGKVSREVSGAGGGDVVGRVEPSGAGGGAAAARRAAASYFLRTLQTVLLVPRYSEPPFFIGTLRLLCENSYLWRVCVVIYERPMTDRMRSIHQVTWASTPRWMFVGSMREAA
jgi:hypothetical protein